MRWLAILVLVVACATPEQRGTCECGLGQVCTVDGTCRAPGDSKDDLPNDGLIDAPHDGKGYGAIARLFGDRGYDLTTDVAKLHLRWPTPNDPVALNRFGTPILTTITGYVHTALDVFRPSPSDSAEVVAPVGGTVLITDWVGAPGYNGDGYSTVVSIWDPESHYIVQLMHVEPTPELLAMTEVTVTAGQAIGSLAVVPLDDAMAGDHLRHTHVDIIDGNKLTALDPARYLPYADHVAPTGGAVYLLDEQAKRHDSLVAGRLDVVVEVSDRDDHSERNFEIAALAFTLTLDNGQVIGHSDRCNFSELIERVGVPYSTLALSLLDFGNANSQVGIGEWPGSDIDNRDRTFRYALTQFGAVSGRCIVDKDDDGFINMPLTATSMTVSVTAWDRNDNELSFERVLRR